MDNLEYAKGYAEGVDKGKSTSFNSGFEDGISSGVSKGYYVGWLNGMKDILENTNISIDIQERYAKILSKLKGISNSDIENKKLYKIVTANIESKSNK